LLDWYEHDPDPGIHGAIDWLLRHRMEGPEKRPLDWGGAKELERIDQALKRRDPDGKRRWYVNGQGQTLVLVPGPVQFRMGAPAEEQKQDPKNERLHLRRIERSFAIGSKAVTVEQYQRFLKDRPDVNKYDNQTYSPSADCPISSVSWYAAAQYCNWLSEQEGIPETEWCYPRHAEIKAGMKPYPDYLRRKGYRLPTEGEWEYACRVGADASRYYGSSIELLPRYAWYLGNSPERMQPVGQKRPNDLGLFDLHGNAWTWTDYPYDLYPTATLIVDKENMVDIKDGISRVLRGGAFLNLPVLARSATRGSNRPGGRGSYVGLRVARTYD
jgi:formylglycine-generating enzyme required for sulfatase activity